MTKAKTDRMILPGELLSVMSIEDWGDAKAYELLHELRTWQIAAGDKWREVMTRFHDGRPESFGVEIGNVSALFRRIRNDRNIPLDPASMPDLRDNGTPVYVGIARNTWACGRSLVEARANLRKHVGKAPTEYYVKRVQAFVKVSPMDGSIEHYGDVSPVMVEEKKHGKKAVTL